MKKLIVLVFLLLVSFINPVIAQTASDGISAQDRDAKASLYIGSIRRTVNIDIKETNKIGVGLAAEQEHQLATAELIMAGFATWETERDKHQENVALQNEDAIKQRQFADEVNVQVDAYNASCHGTVVYPLLDWCLRERDRLQPLIDRVIAWGEAVNAWSDEVNKNRERLLKNLDTLNAASDQLDKDGNDIHQRGLKYFGRYNRLVQQVKDFGVRLEGLQAGFDVCKNAQGTLEKVHEICGTMFDGNVVQETETNYPVPDPTFKFYDGATRCTPQKTFCLEAIK
ncbi:MAG: hypothetical protein WC791_02105 [Candidatus Paceibacterota bacterium]|jgi:hypothetical protein